MKYLIIWTEIEDEDNGIMKTAHETVDDFSVAMAHFTLLCATTNAAIVIEESTKKVICSYVSRGSVKFNDYLINAAR